LIKEALEAHRQAVGTDHPDTLRALNNYAAILWKLGRTVESVPLYLEAMEGRRRIMGPEHRETLIAMHNCAMVLTKAGRAKDAEPLVRELLLTRRRLLGSNHPDTISAQVNFAAILERLGRDDEAESALAEVFRLADESPIDAKQAAQYASRYGPLLVKLGRYRDAEHPLRMAIEKLRATGQEAGRDMRTLVGAMVEVCLHTDRATEAETWRAQLAQLEAATRPASATTPTTRSASQR
jgi:tetratricopeptide (TPR) repeat protein